MSYINYPNPEILEQVRKHYGTPIIVYDEDGIRSRMREYVDNFRSDRFDCKVLYASKAFLCRAVAEMALAESLHFDVVSGGELYCLAQAGITADRIYFHGNNKTQQELHMIFRMGQAHIIVDNMDELELLCQVAAGYETGMDILIRVNPGVEAHTHQYIATASKDSKFGISIDPDGNIAAMVNRIRETENLHFRGFHSHIGSQILEAEAFLTEIRVMFGFIRRMRDRYGIETRELDLGGGFGIPYLPEDQVPSISEVCRQIIDCCQEELEARDLTIETLFIEPGRSLVGDLGHTLYTAGSRKRTESVEYLFVDGGMADNIRPALYEAEYSCSNVSRTEAEADHHYCIAGKCCESGDILIRDAILPESEAGDLILVHSTGAYGYSMASNYNRLGRPAVVFLSGDKHRLVIRRETFEDMLSLEI